MKNFYILLALLFLISCSSQKNNTKVTTIESTLIAKGNLHGNGEEGIRKKHMIISDVTTWTNLIAQMNAVNTTSNTFTETDIDFSTHRVIAVFDEVRTSGGYHLDIQLTATTNRIVVTVTNIAPSGNVSMIMTQPFYIVKIDNTQLPIVFE
ncbi:protease complex subunit PrcB family protein [Kordia zhangzhouensis]|uniref:protease complex subunit PrcB family protein n=1 Tax=Kordia zhangzhouensis TaxID=1620405 RepID=UPI0006295916|nr:protease complex subunit PrcB family protein [Kordia zhangzhouensis]